MFFVFGSPRSGTTLISQSLSAHPEIHVPNETQFIVPAAFLFDRMDDGPARREALKLLITGERQFHWGLGEYLSAAEVVEIIEAQSADSFAAFLNALYDAVARRAGKQIGGDKSPNDLGFFGILRKTGALDPPVKIIHVVRDVRFVIASSIEHGWVTADRIDNFVRAWTNSNAGLYTSFGGAPNYLLVRYEDFVRDPEGQTARMCGHLGRAFHPDTIDPARKHTRFTGVAHHAKLYSPISSEQTSGLDGRLSEAAREACRAFAPANTMRMLGYEAT